jgi:YihY family inner membrane protein
MRRVGRELSRFYWGSGISDDVPALAWTIVVTLVPLALGLGALATVIFEKGTVQAFAERAANVFPKEIHHDVVKLITDTRKQTPLLLTLAVAGMVWTASGSIGVIERCLSRLLNRDRADPFRRKLRHLWMSAGLVVVIALLVIVVTETTQLGHRLGIDGTVTTLVGLPAIGVLVAVICALLYRLAPRGEIPWRPALIGGLPAAAVLIATPTVVRYYLEGVASRSAIGVFLVLIGVLFTCWGAAFGLIIGAGVTARVALGHPLPDTQPEPVVGR